MMQMKTGWAALSRPLSPDPFVNHNGGDGQSAPDSTAYLPGTYRPAVAELNSREFKYLAEGRANIVFRILPATRKKALTAAAVGETTATTTGGRVEEKTEAEEEVRDMFEETLLRVPKHTAGATPFDYAALHRFHKIQIESLVGREHVVPQVLTEINAATSERLNLARHEANSHRKGATVEGGGDSGEIRPGAAMLIQDMGAPLATTTMTRRRRRKSAAAGGHDAAAEDRFLEFKPKWLEQSPVAPPGAVRCRTCAREAFRGFDEARRRGSGAGSGNGSGNGVPGGRQNKAPPVCPLGLVHADARVVMGTLERLAPASWPEASLEALAAALESSGVLRRLRALQVDADPGRALLENPEAPSFALAMTLRDCSCFVRMTSSSSSSSSLSPSPSSSSPASPSETAADDVLETVTIKLADLDKKNASHKKAYWRESHDRLVDGGWYTEPANTHCILELEARLAVGAALPEPFARRLFGSATVAAHAVAPVAVASAPTPAAFHNTALDMARPT